MMIHFVNSFIFVGLQILSRWVLSSVFIMIFIVMGNVPMKLLPKENLIRSSVDANSPGERRCMWVHHVVSCFHSWEAG